MHLLIRKLMNNGIEDEGSFFWAHKSLINHIYPNIMTSNQKACIHGRERDIFCTCSYI